MEVEWHLPLPHKPLFALHVSGKSVAGGNEVHHANPAYSIIY
jgi:hypothetical protein